MTYILSLAIQIAVIGAVIAIVLFLVRPGRQQMPDEVQNALGRLHDELNLMRDTLQNAVTRRISDSATETRQMLLERVGQSNRELLTQLEQRLKEAGNNQAAYLKDALGRSRTQLDEIGALIHRNAEVMGNLRESFRANLGQLEEQLRESGDKQAAAHVELGARIAEVPAQMKPPDLSAPVTELGAQIGETSERVAALERAVTERLSQLEQNLRELTAEQTATTERQLQIGLERSFRHTSDSVASLKSSFEADNQVSLDALFRQIARLELQFLEVLREQRNLTQALDERLKAHEAAVLAAVQSASAGVPLPDTLAAASAIPLPGQQQSQPQAPARPL
jgi:hypothetical protein